MHHMRCKCQIFQPGVKISRICAFLVLFGIRQSALVCVFVVKFWAENGAGVNKMTNITYEYRYGRKVWLTEFAMCCTHDLKEVEEFVRVLLESFNENCNIQIHILIEKHTKIEFRASSHGWRQQTLSTATLGSSQGKQVQHTSYFHMLTSRFSHDGGNGGNWFLDGSVNALFLPDSDQLSSVGHLYNEL